MEADPFTFKTKPWKRGENSYASTIPQQLLAIRGVDPSEMMAVWEINTDTGKIELDFEQRNDE